MKLQPKSIIFGSFAAFAAAYLLNNPFIAPAVGLVSAFSFHLDMSWKCGAVYGFAVGIATNLYGLVSKSGGIESLPHFLSVGLILCAIYSLIGAVFAKLFGRKFDLDKG